MSRSEVLVSGKIWQVWKVRLPFLAITIVSGLLLAGVMSGFEDVLYSIPIVAFFMPMIMDMGGSVGTQSTTLFVRGVALGHIDLKMFGKHLFREVRVGFSIGVVAGFVAGTVAAIWGGVRASIPQLGLAVGLAILVAVTLASLLGFLIPFALLKLKFDQAAGSAPLITSIKDVISLLLYFGFASLFLGHLLY
jgi:magnesium transporter